MKKIEITFTKYQKELEKLDGKLIRAEKAYEKKLDNAKKYGVENMTCEERNEWLAQAPSNNGFLTNKEDIKKNGAWFDLQCAERDLEDIRKAIKRAEARLAKAEQAVTEYHAELDRIATIKDKEKYMAAEFEKEQKEWAKDGITLEGRYYGTTPNGKPFVIYGNNGMTMRSLHCFTLSVNGATVFTSGEFWRAYSIIKKS